MKTIEHESMHIEDFQEFYSYLHKQYPEVLGAEWNKETKILKVFYEDGATELTEEVLQNLKIPTVLRFRKKVTPPKLDAAAAVSATENEFTVETFDAEAVRKEVKEKLTEFEEVSQ
jgi:hypothetical protein